MNAGCGVAEGFVLLGRRMGDSVTSLLLDTVVGGRGGGLCGVETFEQRPEWNESESRGTLSGKGGARGGPACVGVSKATLHVGVSIFH